jgi:RNA polymerase sigma-70 factor (ECF subfamily)
MPTSDKKNINQKSDIELIARYKQSDDLEVLGILYNRYIQLVYGVSLKYFKNPDESQDAAMQIFEKLIESLKKHDIRNFKSWLHVTTRNYCLMELRSRKTRGLKTDTDLSLIPDMEFTTSEHHNSEPDIENDLTLMKQCIDKLPDEQKKCIELFYLEQRSYKEVSLLAEFELKKVKSFIQNGKRNIKNCIEQNRE